MRMAVLTFHLLAVVAAVGGALGQSVLLGRARGARDAGVARAYRLAAAVPTRWLEVPGMIAALASGAVLAWHDRGILGIAFGAKMIAVAWLGATAVIELRATSRIAELADAQGPELDERVRIEARLMSLGKVSALAVVAAVALGVVLAAP